ncbi:MAG: hemerythrin [Legionella sp.]|nr:MAG: hemerythrin [Legionella sp.]
MNAIDFLIKEHNKVRSMFADINDDSHRFETQKKMFSLLADELIRHETIEHLVWYPHFKENLPDTVKHLLTEEKHAEKAIKKLETLKTEPTWKEHFIKLKNAVEHHAQEEEKKLFPEVKKLLSEKELNDIGLKMYEFKQDNS